MDVSDQRRFSWPKSIRVLVIYEFQLHSTHGDAYYIGLNGLEFYDENGERMGLIEQSNDF